MFLTRLILNPRSPQVQRDLANCQALHCRVMTAFPDGIDGPARERCAVLFRVETNRRLRLPTVLVQSAVPPNWFRLPEGYLASSVTDNPAMKPLAPVLGVLRAGTRCRFRLRANPTKRAGKSSDLAGKRVDLRREDDRAAWLARKAADHGFRLIALENGVADVLIGAREDAHGYRISDGVSRRLDFGGAVFEGRLVVEDQVRFRDAIVRGIGPGKAYGFGLLSVAPAP